jgi:hypothetical protein
VTQGLSGKEDPRRWGRQCVQRNWSWEQAQRPTRAHRRTRRHRPHGRRRTAPANTSPKFRARPLGLKTDRPLAEPKLWPRDDELGVLRQLAGSSPHRAKDPLRTCSRSLTSSFREEGTQGTNSACSPGVSRMPLSGKGLYSCPPSLATIANLRSSLNPIPATPAPTTFAVARRA